MITSLKGGSHVKNSSGSCLNYYYTIPTIPPPPFTHTHTPWTWPKYSFSVLLIEWKSKLLSVYWDFSIEFILCLSKLTKPPSNTNICRNRLCVCGGDECHSLATETLNRLRALTSTMIDIHSLNHTSISQGWLIVHVLKLH